MPKKIVKTVEVTLTATADRSKGKTRVLEICKEALQKEGYLVFASDEKSPLGRVRSESILVEKEEIRDAP